MTDWLDWQGPLATWGVPLFLLAVALWLAAPALGRYRAERRLRRRLRRAGAGMLESVVLPDGLEGEVFIDYLLLTPRSIDVLMVQRYRGAIFAAEGMDNWSQVVGARTWRFANPLPELERNVMAVLQVAGKVPVEGHLVVSGEARFPKGQPAAVRGIETFAPAGGEAVPTPLRQAWQALRQAARPLDRQERRLWQESSRPADGVRDGLLALILAALAAAWLIWRLELLS